MSKEDLNMVTGGEGEDAPASAEEEQSEMEKTTQSMDGMGGYGNRPMRR